MTDTVTICGWCPELNILALQRRDTDAVIIFQRGRTLRVTRNETVLRISTGICTACREKHFPDQIGQPLGLEAPETLGDA